jgi:hypothetical protein
MIHELHDNRSGDDEGDSFHFELSLPFQVPECSACGSLVTQEICQCGVKRPPMDPDPHVTTRRRAFQVCAQRAESLLVGFDELPDGAIPLAPDQFVLALRESDLVTKIGDSYKIGSALNDLDLCDPKVVGSDARRAIEEHLDHTEALLAACRELAGFRPQPPGDELRNLATEAGKYGAELAAALIRALTAATYAEAAIARDHIEKLWARFPLSSRLSETLQRLEPWSEPNVDARVALAIGREGRYTNDSGDLDPALLFIAFAEDENPYESLSQAAWRYVSPHTNLSTDIDPAASGVIVAPLAMLAASERPLRSHRIARTMLETATAALDTDQAAVEELGHRAANEGPSIFGALTRVTRAFSELAEDSDDEDAVDRIVRSYRQIAETSYRTVGWLALGLESIAEGKGLPAETQPPTLGPLQQRLAAGGTLARALADGIDVDLRNAEAHVQYRWVSEREVVRDFRTEQEWTVDDLEAAIHELTGSITGADAGYACFVISAGLSMEIPAWLHDGGTPEVADLLAGMSFGAKGFEVVRTVDGGATVVVRSQPDLDSARLLPALAGMVPFAAGATTFKVEDAEGSLLAEVRAETMRQSVSGPALFKDLAVIATVYESAVRTGMDPECAGREFIALINKVVAVTGLQELVDKELAPSAFRDLNDRLKYAVTLAQAPLGLEIHDVAAYAKRIGRVRATVSRASRGNQAALESLTTHLTNLAKEADEVGAVWPPTQAQTA